MRRPVVLITGCSGGIGRASAIRLARAGCDVVATARRVNALGDLGATLVLPLDVTDRASIDAAVDTTLERFGRIDALVNCAGIAVRGAVEELDPDDVARVFDVNVLGMMRLVSAIAPVMRRQGSGRIVTIGSIAGVLTAPANGAYSASKHAVEALNDALSAELWPFGVRVVLVEPGPIGTGFIGTALRRSAPVLERADSPYAPLYARFTRVMERGRSYEQQPEVVARTVVRALRARRPHPRYWVAIPPPMRVAAALPDALKATAIRRFYGARAAPMHPAAGASRRAT